MATLTFVNHVELSDKENKIFRISQKRIIDAELYNVVCKLFFIIFKLRKFVKIESTFYRRFIIRKLMNKLYKCMRRFHDLKNQQSKQEGNSEIDNYRIIDHFEIIIIKNLQDLKKIYELTEEIDETMLKNNIF